jgi:methionyl-tRNA synthetase
MATGRKGKGSKAGAGKAAAKAKKAAAKAKKAAASKPRAAKAAAKTKTKTQAKAKEKTTKKVTPKTSTGAAKKPTPKKAKKPAAKSVAKAEKATRKTAKPKPSAPPAPRAAKRAVTPKEKDTPSSKAAPAKDGIQPTAGRAAPLPAAVVPLKRPGANDTRQPVADRHRSAKTPYFITTPIFYPNGVPHIGHAYTAMVTDVIARFQRLDGFDVRFLTGTDEHGLKMQQAAVAEGLTPLALADRNSARFRDMMGALNISYDDYIRTTEPRHERACQALWMAIEKAGDIYLDKYAGWYSVRQEAYFDEGETTLDEDGIRREPLGSPVEWTEEETYFFRLSAYQDRLLDLYERIPDFVSPRERLNEVVSFVKSGLQDLSVSRTTFDWGIPVPGAPDHVMYVWIDALTNYITGAGYPDTDSESFQRYWPASLHMIGKDILRFHAVYWPAFLMSAGIEVPQRIFSHGFLLNRGEKMSKSVGNVVDPFAMAEQYGVDQMRYFFMREVSFGQDGSYNHEAIVARTNADLANDLGNLAQRSLSMISKQYGGVLPEPGAFSDSDRAILAQADAMMAQARAAMATQQIHQALNVVWAVVAEANRYFAGEAPWALAKTDPPRQRTVLYVTAEVVRQVSILAQPVMPQSSARLLDLLGIPADQRDFTALGGDNRIRPGTELPAPMGIFPRYIEPSAA